jgi:hypothetical protein
MRVASRHPDIGVAEHLLHDGKRHALVEKESGSRLSVT